MGSVGAHLLLPTPAPLAPGMFRRAQPGLLAGLLAQASFQNIRETELQSAVEFDGPESYWQNMLEMAAPVVATMRQANEPTRLAI